MNIRLSLLAILAIVLLPVAPAYAADTVRPTVGTITPSSAVVGTPVTFRVPVSDDVGVSRCSFYLNFVKRGDMSVSGGYANITHTFSVRGIQRVYVLCYDTSGKFSTSPILNVNVTASGASGVDAPIMTEPILPDNATVGIPVRLHLKVTDDAGIESCNFSIVGFPSVPMQIGDDEAYIMYTFATQGYKDVYALCYDVDGHFASSPVSTIHVFPGYPESESAYAGDLIKTNCPEFVYVNDPCTTVYYYGYDGKRHPFPNEKNYFSWYVDYASLKIVSAGFMAAVPIGPNITYKPGQRMVKFPSDNRVFMVARGAVLRPVASEAVAALFYGPEWSKKIDDVNEVFYRDYDFGDDVATIDDYSPYEEASTAIIEDQF